MRIGFVRILRVFHVLAAALLAGSAALAQISITDVTGRTVTLDAPAKRVVLGDARQITILAMLMDDPVAPIAGWRVAKGLDPVRRAALQDRFPALEGIANVGSGNRQLSIESTIALQPDLVILSLTDAVEPGAEQIREILEAADIPVIYVDFFSEPIANTVPSLGILGQVFAVEPRAQEVIDFYAQRLSHLRARLAEADPKRPRAFVQVHATPAKCCATVGAGVFHDFITEAGGYNLGQDVVPGLMGNVSLESLIALNPDVFIATGGLHLSNRGGLVLGAGVAPDVAQSSFAAILNAPGIADLETTGQAIAIWHLFNDSPYHIALIEYLAQRFHPELFADLDPQATLRQMQSQFSPIAVDGVWWLNQSAQ